MAQALDTTTKIDTKAFNRTVAALVIPMALQNLINVSVQSADVVMLGMVGEVALSAASLAGQVQFVLMLIYFGLASGAAVLTAQYWGKGDIRSIEKVLGIALRFSLTVSVVFTAAALLAPHTLMRIFSNEAEVIELGAQYLRVVAPCYLTTAFSVVFLNIMRSVEKVIISTVVYSISLVVNIIANAVFIFGLFGLPAMGVVGAALGTTCARFVELVIVAVYSRRNQVLRFHVKDIVKMDRVLLGDFIRYAMPTTLNELVWSLGVSANSAIIGRLGAAAVAANSVGQVTRQLATTVSFGVGQAAAIMVGKALGSGQPGRAQIYASRLIKLALITGGCGSVLVFLLREIIPGIMNLSPIADDYLRFILLVMCAYVFFQAITAVMVVGVFRGGGDTRFGLFLDAFTMWGCSILFGFLAAFVFHWPPKAVLFILLMDELVKVPLCIIRYKSRRWLKNVTR